MRPFLLSLFSSQDAGGEEKGRCCLIELLKHPIGNHVATQAIEASQGDQKEQIHLLISASREELVRVLGSRQQDLGSTLSRFTSFSRPFAFLWPLSFRSPSFPTPAPSLGGSQLLMV